MEDSTIQLSTEVIKALLKLPQVEKQPDTPPFDNDLWQIDYFVDQLLRNQLGLDADYDLSDLEIILKGGVIV